MVSLGLLLIRLIIGGIFTIHGYTKIFGGPGKGKQVPPETEEVLGEGFSQFMDQGGIESTADYMANLEIPSPKPAAIALAAAEFGGGLALILGWKTRPAALALTFSQLVAINKVHREHGLIAEQGFEANAALIAGTGALVLAGPGAIALD